MKSLCLEAVFVCCIAVLKSTPETVDHGGHKTSHLKDGLHNPVFDQEALLGSHKIDEFVELPEDVRIKRLRNLAKSHDANNNDIIEAHELKEWVLESFRMLDREEAMEKLEDEDENNDGKVTFDEILHKQYGYSEEDLEDVQKEAEDDDGANVFQLITDDRNRFAVADVNKDGFLDETEYIAYFQPYDFPYMYDVEMERAMKDLDKDTDGYISIQEFIGENSDEETRLSEMTNFEELDKDKDGKLTPEELRPWALPDNNESAVEEVEHLLSICDDDKDGHLSIDEIVSKEDEFLRSTATDYGRTLHFVKDEL
uniref:Reticulocalbin-3 n=1 Tax=Arion vulgaris TaxID=1028688 RepID=A0A0B7B4B9_9EUPU